MLKVKTVFCHYVDASLKEPFNFDSLAFTK